MEGERLIEKENSLKNKKRVKRDQNNLEELRFHKRHSLESLKYKKNSMEKINWGILGLGEIAHKFSEGFIETSNAKLLAAASKDQEKSKKFKDQFNIRPLVIGKKNDNYIICSESVAITSIDYELLGDVYGNFIITFNDEGLDLIKLTYY